MKTTIAILNFLIKHWIVRDYGLVREEKELEDIPHECGYQHWSFGSKGIACPSFCYGGLCRNIARPSQPSPLLSLCNSWLYPWTPSLAWRSYPCSFSPLCSFYSAKHSFIKSQTKDEVKKENPHPLLSFIRHCSNHANPKQRYKKLQEDNEKAYVHYFTPT